MKNSNSQVFHKSVMPEQVVKGLNCTSGRLYIDCTAGGGGHSLLIANAIKPDGKLICLDVDSEAIEQIETRLKGYNNVYIFKTNYGNLTEVLKSLNLGKVTGGILMDLGVSSYQLTSQTRGFSFGSDSKLDMRMDTSLEISAFDVINTFSVNELANIFFKYGEERYSRRIASRIIDYRDSKEIKTTFELAEIVKSAVPKSNKMKIHPATRVFQAVRIFVNNELEILEQSLIQLLDLTEPGARIAIISFHSLEDRIVKQFFKHWSKECICPPGLPECRCEHNQMLRIITKKPLIADSVELEDNISARSAKLRIAERI